MVHPRRGPPEAPRGAFIKNIIISQGPPGGEGINKYVFICPQEFPPIPAGMGGIQECPRPEDGDTRESPVPEGDGGHESG